MMSFSRAPAPYIPNPNYQQNQNYQLGAQFHQASSSSFNPFAVCSNAEAVGDTITPAPKPVKLSDRNTILNTREKYEIFYKLSVISGITKEEILREIRDCPNSQLNEDNILYRIISKKDPEAVSAIYLTM